MEVHLKALLELIFFTKPLNFGVEAHIEALAGVAISSHFSSLLAVCSVNLFGY
jgi:hypothetical protein